MSANWKVGIFIIGAAVFSTASFAQMDAPTLRAKYGEPLARETFQARPNLEILVYYGLNHQVCKVELPPGRNVVGEVPARIPTTQQVDEVLAELLPPATRGQELNRSVISTGRVSLSVVEYEHVAITELLDPDHPGRRTKVTAFFKHEACSQPPL